MKIHLQSIKMVLSTLTLAVCAMASSRAAGTMVTITNSPFLRGDSADNNVNGDAPPKWVNVDTFRIEPTVVTYAQWLAVYQWAKNNGYTFSRTNSAGSAFGNQGNMPVQTVDWYDAIKWCNARTEMENAQNPNGPQLSPCYYTVTDPNRQNDSAVYRQGEIPLATNNVMWPANGYRLPTEAEWEKAARGGLVGQRFPNGLTISHRQATYQSPGITVIYDAGPPYVNPITTSPVATLLPNNFGLYDMAGNVLQWCWDAYAKNYYTGSSSTNNPIGPVSGITRVARGGSWTSYATGCRTGLRCNFYPNSAGTTVGFRVAQSIGSGSNNGGRIGQTNQNIYFDFDFNQPPGPPTLTSATNFQLNARCDSSSQVTFTIVADTLSSIVSSNVLSIGSGTVTVMAHADAGTNNGISYYAANRTVVFNVAPPPIVAPAVTTKTLTQFLASSTNIVDQAGLNAVLAHYWSQSPPWITNATFPGRTNFCFNITNFAFTVQCSTDNLATWQNLGGHARIVFDDTNALTAPTRFYRLVGSTNY